MFSHSSSVMTTQTIQEFIRQYKFREAFWAAFDGIESDTQLFQFGLNGVVIESLEPDKFFPEFLRDSLIPGLAVDVVQL